MMSYGQDEAEAPLDPAAERLRRKLVRLLLVSGGIMLLGFIAVFAAIAYRIGQSGAASSQPAITAPLSAVSVATRVAVPPGSRLVSTTLEGRRALLTLEAPDRSSSLVLLDLDSGRVLGRYSLVPDAALIAPP